MTKKTPMTNIEGPRPAEETLLETIGMRAPEFVIPSSLGISSSVIKLPLITLGVAILSLALMCSASLSEILQFDREAVAAGQLWRVVTGHLTHWNLDHLIWDGVVFAVLGVLCERKRGRFMFCLTAAAVLISVSVWLLLPELNIYRGLSGLDTALFTMLAGGILAEKWAAREWRWVTIIAGLMIGLGFKVAFEVDRARRKLRPKHGGDRQRLDLEIHCPAIDETPERLLAIDEAFGRLEKEHSEIAQLVKLRFFAGVSLRGAADLLGVSLATAKRRWAFARAFLYGDLCDSAD